MTDLYEAYSIEEGDTIMLKGNAYHVLSITDGSLKDYTFRIMDDEGFIHEFEADFSEKVRVVVDPYVEA
jgi:hypothetical protein